MSMDIEAPFLMASSSLLLWYHFLCFFILVYCDVIQFCATVARNEFINDVVE